MKSIYILLTRTNTLFARLFYKTTGDAYTHASLGLDRNLSELYSFARLYPRIPLPGGFIMENIYTGVFKKNKHAPAILFELKVSDKVYKKIKNKVEDMMRQHKKYRYNLIGIITCMLCIPYERQYHYFCSQFVAEVLQQAGALQLPKNPSLMKPVDFFDLPKLEQIYTGALERCVPDAS